MPSRVRAHRHHQAVRRDPGAGRRVARPARRARSTRWSARTARARARWSRSSPASTSRTAATIRLDGEPTVISRPGAGPLAGDRGRPPGAAPVPGPERRRERVHRATRRPGRCGPSTGARRAGRRQALFEELDVQFDVRALGPRPVDGRPAADRDREGAVGRRERPDPRRADGVAVGPRGRAPVHDRPRPARPRRRDPVRQPSAGRGVRPVRHARPCSATAGTSSRRRPAS